MFTSSKYMDEALRSTQKSGKLPESNGILFGEKQARVLRMAKEEPVISARLPARNKAVGALVILIVFSLWLIGPSVPLILVLLVWTKQYQIAVGLFTFIVALFLIPFKESPRFCSWFLKSAGWFDKGVTLIIEERIVKYMANGRPMMWCIHPHGVLTFGFALNGAVRFKSRDPKLMPPELSKFLPAERIARISGVQAPVLFRLPFVRQILGLFGASTPATKEGVLSLLKKKSDFGILPGGSEELIYFEAGKEYVYIKHRAGFIKYALQYGYQLAIAYTFGEADLYNSLQYGRSLRLWVLKRFGFVVPIFWGKYWWCPLLPFDNVAINTVVGEVIELPTIPNPTNEDVEKYHQMYVKSLTELFDRHKARFGYGDRQLLLV
eukprot:c8838_g1_i1.p1 GENE.c8838_g1_i1~~c8838_g1_i1.p1  ORF type:complete len:379 (+),score=71.21 c8838_g1_i1:1155-2291(+)